MSNPSAVDVEVRLRLKDGATAGMQAVTQAAEQSASKSAAAAEKAASKSVAAVQAQHDSHIKAYRDIARARETLGVGACVCLTRERRCVPRSAEAQARVALGWGACACRAIPPWG